MLEKLFAFNVSVETPESEMYELTGQYDAKEQVWTGINDVMAPGCCGSTYHYTTQCSCPPLNSDLKLNHDCE